MIERWHDELLYWDPEEFDNITETKLHYTQLWIPDTTLYNTWGTLVGGRTGGLQTGDEGRRPAAATTCQVDDGLRQ